MVAPVLVLETSSVAMAVVVPTVIRLSPRPPPPDKAMVPALMVASANELVPVSVRALAPACNSVGPDVGNGDRLAGIGIVGKGDAEINRIAGDSVFAMRR